MYTPQFKGGNVELVNEKTIPSYEARKVAVFSLVGLYFSEALLFVGVTALFLNSIGIIAPEAYFGSYSWVTLMVFLFGIIINFFSIPFLYFSSFENFKHIYYIKCAGTC